MACPSRLLIRAVGKWSESIRARADALRLVPRRYRADLTHEDDTRFETRRRDEGERFSFGNERVQRERVIHDPRIAAQFLCVGIRDALIVGDRAVKNCIARRFHVDEASVAHREGDPRTGFRRRSADLDHCSDCEELRTHDEADRVLGDIGIGVDRERHGSLGALHAGRARHE